MTASIFIKTNVEGFNNAQSQGFNQEALKHMAISNSYKTKEKIASLISCSLTSLSFGSIFFNDVFGQSNRDGSLTLGLFLASYLPWIASRYFSEKASDFHKSAQANISLANGYKISII